MSKTIEALKQHYSGMEGFEVVADLLHIAGRIAREKGGPEEFDDVQVAQPESLTPTPEELVDIKRSLIEAFIERQAAANSIPWTTNIDFTLAELVNQEIGAKTRDNMPISALSFPTRSYYNRFPQNRLKDFGLERIEDIDVSRRRSWNQSVDSIKRNNCPTVGLLRTSGVPVRLYGISSQRFLLFQTTVARQPQPRSA